MSESPHYEPFAQQSTSVYKDPTRSAGRRWLPVLLFCLTIGTTTVAGALTYSGFYLSKTGTELDSLWSAVLGGLSYSVAILTILLSHEMGHYLTCRYYHIDATLPYFLPAPPFPFGTFGAVIKIKSMFANTRQLFDVAIGGPLAGFLVILPALFIGVRYSTRFDPNLFGSDYWEFGEPLILKMAMRLVLPGYSENMTLHPIGLAAWFGLFATSFNLLPIGQLDGGHIVYSVLGPRGHRICSYLTLGVLLTCGVLLWPGYFVVSALVFFLGFRHPPAVYLNVPLGSRRILLALLALAVFVLCFIPVPVKEVLRH